MGIRFTLFLSPLIFALVAFEIGLHRIETSYKKKAQLLDQKASSIETLVLGNSNAFHNLNPEMFSRPGFNLANTSQSLSIDRQLFEKYIDTMTHLKTLVITLSYFSFEYLLAGEPDDFRLYFYPSNFGIMGDGGFLFLVDLRMISLLARFGNTVSKRVLLSGFSENLAKEVSATGWYDNSLSTVDHLPVTEIDGKSRADFHTSAMHPDRTVFNIEAISSMIHLCRNRKVHVVLVRTPASPTYFRHLNHDAEDRFIRNTEQLKFEHRISVYDYLRDPRFTVRDFYDNDHLAAPAAKKFSRIFDEEVLETLPQTMIQ